MALRVGFQVAQGRFSGDAYADPGGSLPASQGIGSRSPVFVGTKDN